MLYHEWSLKEHCWKIFKNQKMFILGISASDTPSERQKVIFVIQYFKHVFCPGEGNKFPKTLDLCIKVLLKYNDSVCDFMVVQLFKLSTIPRI